MDHTIDQFMWGFQPHFRIRVELGVGRALSQIGLPVDVRVVLVGFALDGSLRHQLCIEPELGPLSVNHLDNVLLRTNELVKANPESDIRISNPRYQQLRLISLYRRSRGDALVEAIEQAGVFKGLTFFASEGAPIAPIGSYEVHTCVGVPTAALESLPALEHSEVEQVYVGRSLQHEVISECLQRADRALYLPDPGTDLNIIGTAEDLIMTAAKRLTDRAAYRATGWLCDLFSSVNEFASLGYERGGAKGHIVIASHKTAADRLQVRFQKPVPINRARSMRKLLELTDDSTSVLVDDPGAYGLGSCASGPNVVEISVTGHAEWELSIDGSALVRVSYGQATLPRPLLNIDEFTDTAERNLGTVEHSRIWAIIQQAQTCGHGMALVVSGDPKREAARLGGQAVSVDPALLEPAEVVRLGRVDGAVLLGPDGRCYAFGVILDGTASGQGDPARGSRFNSAVSYQNTTGAGSIVVVISDDGMVDLIPRLKPRVRREHVEEVVRAFLACCEAENVDGREFARMHELVKSLAFYLDDEQCRVVNEHYEIEMNRRFEAGDLRLSQTSLQPHPDMNESYFL